MDKYFYLTGYLNALSIIKSKKPDLMWKYSYFESWKRLKRVEEYLLNFTAKDIYEKEKI